MRMRKRLQTTGIFLLLLCMIFICGITGTAAEKKITLNKSSVTVKKNETVQLKLKGASGKVKWSSSKKSIATVTSAGKITAKKVGTCVIKAVYRKKTYTCTVTVTKSATERMLEKYPVKKNKGRILLAGSSSIARWSSAASAFAPYEIVNVGISGTTIQQWSKWYKSLIVPYEPEAVILYVGGNDLWKRTTPAQTAKLVCNTMKKLRKELPDTQIYFVSVYTNISRKSISKQILAYNKKVKQFCSKYKSITYIDLAAKFNNSGTPLKKLLVDGLHPNAEGYKIWKNVIATKVKADMKKRGIVPAAGSSDSVASGAGNSNTGNAAVNSTGTSGAGTTGGNELGITGAEVYVDEISGELSQVIIK